MPLDAERAEVCVLPVTDVAAINSTHNANADFALRAVQQYYSSHPARPTFIAATRGSIVRTHHHCAKQPTNLGVMAMHVMLKSLVSLGINDVHEEKSRAPSSSTSTMTSTGNTLIAAIRVSKAYAVRIQETLLTSSRSTLCMSSHLRMTRFQ